MVNMRMGLEMKMSQQLIMTPQLQQAIKLLQLSRIELEDFINQSLVENPTLEVTPVEKNDELSTEEETAAAPQNLVEDQQQLSYDDEWQSYIESGAGIIQDVRNHSNNYDELTNPLEATVSNTESLHDHLYWQLDMSNLDELELEIGEAIIGNIDDDGYLASSLREILASDKALLKKINNTLVDDDTEQVEKSEAAKFDLKYESATLVVKDKKKKKKTAPFMLEDEGDIKADLDLDSVSAQACKVAANVLSKVQSFDPAGVAARNLQECLLSQLKANSMEDTLVYQIISSEMKLLEQKDLKRIARRLKFSLDEVIEAYHFITEMEPKPGRPFNNKAVQYVIPDVYIYKRNDEYVVSLNKESLPALRISPHYSKLTEEKLKKEQQKKKEGKNISDEETLTNQYLVEKIKSGEWLMKSIEQRQKTIYRVTESILKNQYEFFEKGIDYLKPLVLRDVALDIDVHESTVSRITTNKFVHTPQGIFELKYFFTSGITQGDGDVISSKKIKDQIRKLIDSEDQKKPHTDLQIVTILKEKEGIEVARRTVAKYREALNILPSNKRKKVF